MGLVFSTDEETEKSRKISRALNIAKVKERDIVKLVLLGTGDSGKTTVMKQIKQNLDKQFTQGDLANEARAIGMMIFIHMRGLVEDILRSKPVLTPSEEEDLRSVLVFGRNNFSDSDVNNTNIKLLLRVWNMDVTRDKWAASAKSTYSESLEHFMSDKALNRVHGYIHGALKKPKKQLTREQLLDLLYLRKPTSGAYSASFFHRRRLIQIYDLGGQRNERKKWIPMLEGTVTTIVYVTAISEYNQYLSEATNEPRMKESVVEWKKLVNNPDLYETSFLLFLNKYDLFKKKVCEVPFKLMPKDIPEGSDELPRNTGYKGENPMDFPPGEEQDEAIQECIDYIKNKFYKVVPPTYTQRTFISQVTTATNPENMKTVLFSIQDHLLRAQLVSAGLNMA